MTVVAIKGRILAVDSLCTHVDTVVGRVKKWTEINYDWGGGFAAGSGQAGTLARALTDLNNTGQCDLPDGNEILWLQRTGAVITITPQGPAEIEAPFYTCGNAYEIAAGAMAAGASAERAVHIACDLSVTCAHPVTVLRLPG